MILGAMDDETRYEQMAESIVRFPTLTARRCDPFKRMNIACYGPSLRDTYKELKHPIMSVSGAHDFLVEKGITPDYHVECDPRKHKVDMLQSPQLKTQYLMASCVHPGWWERLKGNDVRLWHLINGNSMDTVNWVKANHPAGLDVMIGGGSTVGQRAFEISSKLGFKRFSVHGMDCSFEEELHAGPHTGKKQQTVFAAVQNQMFKTTPQLKQAAREMELFLLEYDVDVVFHGVGLLQAVAQLAKGRVYEYRAGNMDKHKLRRRQTRQNEYLVSCGAS
jgi:hypothetical protein